MTVSLDEMDGFNGRLERALGGRALEEVVPAPRALVGFEAAAAVSGDVALVRRAAEKLRAGGKLLPRESAALELGIRLARPALLIEGDVLPNALASLLSDTVRAAINAALPGIASVGWSWDIPLATAFQVTPRVLVTNAHVAEKLLHDREDLSRRHFVARFDTGLGGRGSAIPIIDVMGFHPTEDVAFLELASDGPMKQGLSLAREPRLFPSDRVLAVGYPLYSADAPPFIDALFENLYGVKRASLGECLGMEAGRLYHDCTTLPGSSGSPLFDLRTGLVVGVHASGQFASRNTAVSTHSLYELPWLRAAIATWE